MTTMPLRTRPLIGRFAYVSPEWEVPKPEVTYRVCSVNDITERPLTVRAVDLLKSRNGVNRQEHHTDRFYGDQLIIRRGQPFQMWIEFSRPFDPKKDKLQLQLKLGPNPVISKGTLVIVPFVDELHSDSWEAKITETKDNRIKLSVNSPPTAAIGRYELSAVIQNSNGNTTLPRNPDNDIYILFNPWCKDDTVYMDNEDERNEYVLNDVGRIYMGTCYQIGSKPWNFGQFAEGMLAACMFVLELSRTPASGWGDPVNVSRVVSAMVNSPDDNGILVGNWSDDYRFGTPPTAWNGSVEIVKQFHKSRGIPVKYGQCWVFSGVTTTVLRCLGIPCRSVTNFESAHDTDISLTIDVYYDENMRPINKYNKDSVWNFHVWNDAWMARPDLPAGMGGWQAVDATPQETSQGMYCCGPASVEAIRNGQVYLKYDTPFVFAEVNSDKIHWKMNANGTFAPQQCERSWVGQFISTKAVGSDRREDITHLYKHPEGSKEERIAVETAVRHGSKPNTYSCAVTCDVTIGITLKEEEPTIGKDAKLSINLKNTSSELRTVSLYTEAGVMYYTGVYKATVQKDDIQIELKANEEKSLEWTLPYEQYRGKLVDQAAVKLTLSGQVKETQQILATQYVFRLLTPEIVITPVGDAVVGKEMEAKITFNNPLPHMLRNVKFHIEGLGLQNNRLINYGNVPGLGTVTVTGKFTPTLAGPRKLLASLDCQELTHVHGIADIDVK
ncbi:protein-glutamine gamma-glutamyltransferase K-like [Brachyhypopomus gauderio]|uniref:protein-glutamine gamma-glutamyltransferase K-like n=1 Tax=Brachyhypopomus gauderio TaxID=698409 RepID=UPI0040423C12